VSSEILVCSNKICLLQNSITSHLPVVEMLPMSKHLQTACDEMFVAFDTHCSSHLACIGLRCDKTANENQVKAESSPVKKTNIEAHKMCDVEKELEVWRWHK